MCCSHRVDDVSRQPPAYAGSPHVLQDLTFRLSPDVYTKHGLQVKADRAIIRQHMGKNMKNKRLVERGEAGKTSPHRGSNNGQRNGVGKKYGVRKAACPLSTSPIFWSKYEWPEDALRSYKAKGNSPKAKYLFTRSTQ